MENVKISANDVKKDLYKSKVNAKFSHYSHGKLYYTVELTDGVYIFPISTVENKIEYMSPENEGEDEIEIKSIELSADLGETSFCNEMKGSDLNRWISKAIEIDDFIKIR